MVIYLFVLFFSASVSTDFMVPYRCCYYYYTYKSLFTN